MVKRTGTKASQVRQAFTHKQTAIIAKSERKTGKKGSAFHRGKSSSNPNRVDPSGGKKGSQFRDRATINRLNMYKAKPDKKKMAERPTDPHAGRI